MSEQEAYFKTQPGAFVFAPVGTRRRHVPIRIAELTLVSAFVPFNGFNRKCMVVNFPEQERSSEPAPKGCSSVVNCEFAAALDPLKLFIPAISA